jgi:hypothetical protein
LTTGVKPGKTQSVTQGSFSKKKGSLVKPLLQAFWPLAIIFLLAILALERGGNGVSNPLSDHTLEEWVSVSRR